MSQTAAALLVKCLEAHNVKFIFGIPGAKVDTIFNALVDSSIQLILCRHEQNAAFMAAAYGRLTGEPGVVLVTSGPGVGNLCTGLLTATTEGDPVIAIGGNVARSMLHKASHQSAQNIKMMEGVTKTSEEVYAADNVPEVVANAFRVAKAPKSGACFISLPQDVLQDQTNVNVIYPAKIYYTGLASKQVMQLAAAEINAAKNPIVLLGQNVSKPDNTQAIRALLQAHPLPVIATYQAAGAISKSLMPCFYGRVGLFKNQPGDLLLDQADLIIAIGFNPVEYDPEIWNAGEVAKNEHRKIIHIDYTISDIHQTYQTSVEVLGNIAGNVKDLIPLLKNPPTLEQYHSIREDFEKSLHNPKENIACKSRIHPLKFIYELHKYVDNHTVIACDIGTNYMWMARYFLSHTPHQMLFSNGQQTLGVGLPWAMAAKFAYPDKRVISISGDGGFLFSAMELETAVRENLDIIHFVWVDGSYNMVKEQELMKYHRKSGVEFGYVNIVKFAESFGATGFLLDDSDKFDEIMSQALATRGPVLIEMPVDYSDNPALFAATDPHAGH